MEPTRRMQFVFVLLLLMVTGGAQALEVGLDPKRDSIETLHNGQVVKIQRIQDLNHIISGSFARTSRKCPPHCIQPIQIDPRVKTVGELAVFDALEKGVIDGSTVVVDARLPAWNKKGTIPGSINIPFTVFQASPNDPKLIDALDKLGVRRRGEVSLFSRLLENFGLLGGGNKNEHWDFTHAKHLILFCNGPWCGQSPRAIFALLKLGYPPDRIAYYRGGMQMWQLYGLTTIVP